MEEFQADILVFSITSGGYATVKKTYKLSDTQNVVYSILQYVLQYGSAVLQYISIRFLPYCFTPIKCSIQVNGIDVETLSRKYSKISHFLF